MGEPTIDAVFSDGVARVRVRVDSTHVRAYLYLGDAEVYSALVYSGLVGEDACEAVFGALYEVRAAGMLPGVGHLEQVIGE